jgi:hypothetical protein
MAYVAFISDQFLKDNTWMNQSVDPSLIRPTVRLAQEMYILPLLGTGLYNKVTSLISGSPTVTLSGTYGTLLRDYIQPCLQWYVISESAIPISLRMTNKNIVKKNSDNSTAADLSEILTIKDEARNKAEWYGQRMVAFVRANPTPYPEYFAPGDSCDTITPRRKAYDSILSLTNYHTNSSLKGGGGIAIDYGRNAECCDPKL